MRRGMYAIVMTIMMISCNLVAIVHADQGHIIDAEVSVAAFEGPPAVGSGFDLKGLIGDMFTENRGQIHDHRVIYHSSNAYFMTNGVIFRAIGESGYHIYRMDFLGANDVVPFGNDRISHYKNYFRGSDPSGWVTNVQSYKEMTYKGLYNGIDLVYRVVPDGIKYDFIVHPEGDVSDIRLGFEGVEVHTDGIDLFIETSVGTVVDGDLFVYQRTETVNEPVSARMVARGNVVSFDVDRVPGSTIVIDPLLFSTFIGGTERESANAMAVDASGYIYLTGGTQSDDFQTTPGAYDTTFGGDIWSDAIVVKLEPDGSDLVWSTYVGGSQNEAGADIELDDSGNVYVGGSTRSSDFPATPGAYDQSYAGAGTYEDAYLFRLAANGSEMDFSTFIGGPNSEWASSVEIAPDGSVYLVGTTESDTYPTTSGSFCETFSGGQREIFLTRFKADGSDILNSTFIGGNNWDYGSAMELDQSGNVYLTGMVDSSDFPTTQGAYCTTLNNQRDIYILKMDPDLKGLIYSTYVGGSWWEASYGLAIAPDGSAVVVGGTGSTDFPVSDGAFDDDYDGGDWRFGDGFALKINPDGSDLDWSTYIGTVAMDWAYDVDLRPSGNATIVGATQSGAFPVTDGAYDTTFNGDYDLFLMDINSNASEILYSTYIGGTGGEAAIHLNVDGPERVYLSGGTSSSDFPVTDDGYDDLHNGMDDIFVLMFGLPDLPSEPLDLTASEGNRYVDLNWSEPENASGLIVGYKIFRGPSELALTELTTIGPSLTYNDTDVTNAVTYYYAVSAINGRGEGNSSNVVQATPGWVPSVPRNLKTPSGLGYVHLSWDPPLDDGGYQVTNYTVYRGTNSENIVPITMIGNITDFNDTVVINGQRYMYAVSATNARGEGIRTDTVNGEPGGPPSAPINLTAETGEKGQVNLNWEPPEDNGGYIITRYMIYRGPSQNDLSILDIRPDDPFYTDFSVTAGELYHYVVSANNTRGEGPLSDVVDVVAGMVPSFPTNLTVDDGDGFVDLRWDPPTDDGGMDIIGYRVYKGQNQSNLSFLGKTDTLELNDTNVTNGLVYYYSVSAVNPKGEGAQSPLVTAYPGRVPAPPVLTVRPGDSMARLSWIPGDDGGFPILRYRLFWGSVPDVLNPLKNVTAEHFNDTDLSNGKSYYYAVLAVNKKGEGALSDVIEVIPLSLPGSVRDLSAVPGDRKVLLSWSPPLDATKTMVDGYNIYRGVSEDDLTLVLSLDNTTLDDIGLENGIEYLYRVSAFNTVGEGDLSEIINATPGTAPDAPTNLSAKAKGSRINLKWDRPTNDGGLAVTEYRVYRGDTKDDMVQIGTVKDLSFIDKKAKDGRKYHYQVTAVNAIGESAPTDPVNAKVTPQSSDLGLMLAILLVIVVVIVTVILVLYYRKKKLGDK